MPAASVSVVDQHGALLSGQGEDNGAEAADREFQYSRKVEDDLLRKISDILAPTVGAGRFRAQVAADVDFTARSETGERYDTEQPTLVSDQTRSEKQSGDAPESGVPGALSNTPPAATSVPQTTAATPPPAAANAPNAVAGAVAAAASAVAAQVGTRSRQEETHNYNPPGRTISAVTHQQGSTSLIQRRLPLPTSYAGLDESNDSEYRVVVCRELFGQFCLTQSRSNSFLQFCKFGFQIDQRFTG